MKMIASAVALTVLMAAPSIAAAATVTNLDEEAHTLIVSEGGNQLEIPIGAGETIEICPQGCFVMMPNGDREVLTGGEKLEIEKSRGRIF